MYLKYAGIIISTHNNISIVSLSVEKLVQSRNVICSTYLHSLATHLLLNWYARVFKILAILNKIQIK